MVRQTILQQAEHGRCGAKGLSLIHISGNADDAASAAAPYTLLCALAHGDEESRRLSPDVYKRQLHRNAHVRLVAK